MSLSGRKSPVVADAIPKPKIPTEILTAIHSIKIHNIFIIRNFYSVYISDYMQIVWEEIFTTKDEKGKAISLAV